MGFKVALLQVAPDGTNQDINRRIGEQECRKAAQVGVDIALFPEMWNNGYTFDTERDQWAGEPLTPDSPFIQHFQALAAELKMAICLTYLQAWDGQPRNAASLIDRNGKIVMTYAKVHTCAWDTEGKLTPGDGFYTCDLDTAEGSVKIGIMICFDREFPESARILMLQGAEIILVPNACTLEDNRLSQFRARAYENMIGLAMANYPQPTCNGHSIAYDGIAFSENELSMEMKVIEGGVEEGIYVAEFDLNRMRAYRQKEVWGNAYRRPHLYGLLTAEDVQVPFIRPDAPR